MAASACAFPAVMICAENPEKSSVGWGFSHPTLLFCLLYNGAASRHPQSGTPRPVCVQIAKAASRASPGASTALPGALAASPMTNTWEATASATSFNAALDREPMASTTLS